MQFEVLDEQQPGRSLENRVFRSKMGHRVQLNNVQFEDRRHFQAKLTVLKGASPVGEVEMKTGDLLDAQEDYIVHVCDCVTQHEARGLAARIFQAFPEADVYFQRQASDVPGDVSVHGHVVNLYAQFAPGPPLAGEREYASCFRQLPRGKEDTPEDRLGWFRQCLQALPGRLPAERKGGGPVSLALPVGIGCEGAEENWPAYLSELRAFAREHTELRIVLYSPNTPR